MQQDIFLLVTILPIKIVGYFLFQTTNFVTEKLHEYFFSESCSKSPRATGKTCCDTEPFPRIGLQESSSAGNIHHHQLQTEPKIFKREPTSLRELLIH